MRSEEMRIGTRGILGGALLAALALSGCIDSRVKVTVAPDGSGTVEKTIIVSKALVEFMVGMGAKGDAASIEQSMVSEASLKAGAAKMGSGVTFVSAEKITTEGGNGYKALYSFRDVSTLKLSQDPTSDVTVPSAGSSGSQTAASQTISFTFTPGAPATLTILAPKAQPTSPAEAAPKTQSDPAEAEQMMAMLRPLYEDLRYLVSVEVRGRITDTNASYVDGSVVTLMDMDFGKILADESMFKKLTSSQAQTMAEVQELTKAIPGIKVETKESVVVKFR